MKDTDIHIKGIGILPEKSFPSELNKRLINALNYLKKGDYKTAHYLLYKTGVIEAFLKAGMEHFQNPEGFDDDGSLDMSLKSILGDDKSS